MVVPPVDTSNQKTTDNNTELFLEMMKQNKEMQNFWVEQTKELQNKMVEKFASTKQNISNSNNVNSNNHQFNLNIFLNETCKDALNFSEFIKTIVQNLNLEDLEETGRLGYVDGITRIFVNALKNTEIERRPLHCTDIKRETVYIKEEDKWEKEKNDKDTIKDAIETIANQNMMQINEWKTQNPSCLTDADSTESAVLSKLYMTTMGSCDEDQNSKMKKKIVRKVLHEVIVDKGNVVCNATTVL